MCGWLEEGTGEVAVYDATNTTFARRQLIYETVAEKYGYKLFFVESFCSDPEIIEANIRVWPFFIEESFFLHKNIKYCFLFRKLKSIVLTIKI